MIKRNNISIKTFKTVKKVFRRLEDNEGDCVSGSEKRPKLKMPLRGYLELTEGCGLRKIQNVISCLQRQWLYTYQKTIVLHCATEQANIPDEELQQKWSK